MDMECSCHSFNIIELEANIFCKNDNVIIKQTFCKCQSCGRCFWRYEYFIKDDFVEYIEA